MDKQKQISLLETEPQIKLRKTYRIHAYKETVIELTELLDGVSITRTDFVDAVLTLKIGKLKKMDKEARAVYCAYLLDEVKPDPFGFG